MPNLASILKDEISRVARREVRRETTTLKEASAGFRSEIAALKRRVLETERELRRMSKTARPSQAVAANDESVPQGARFSAKSIASQRRRLGLSAAQCGLLIGASAQSIYNWEEGKARPRAHHLPAIFALRTLGRREANARLETVKEAA
jgi:DNA-binding transcriptional regulator YiaG